MSEEDKQSTNSGISSNPAETDTERQAEDPHSVSFRPSDAGVGVGENGESPEEEERPFPSGGNMSREELESYFRNNPRFARMFDHSEDEKKAPKWSIRVGGIRLTLRRIMIVFVFFLVVLLCLGVCLFYAVKDIGKYVAFKEASALFESGDYDGAREKFIKVLKEDPNKEAAVEAMAQIYHHFGDWNNESFFRQRIMRLNPLDQDAFHAFLESAFRARNFGSIYSILNLKVMDDAALPPDEGALYLIAALNSGHAQNGKAFYEVRKKADPEYFSGTERGRLAERLLNSSKMNREQVWNYIPQLDQIQDPQVRFETINVLLHFLSTQNDREADEKMEALLLEAVKLNDFAGVPLLANYYFSRYRFDDTIRVCEEFLKTKINAIIPILYGESCVLSGQPELLVPLTELIRSLRGRQSMIIASYLDALSAFAADDNARLPGLLQSAGSTIDSPLFSLMKLQVALQQDSSNEILHYLRIIMNGRPFMDFQQRARTAVLRYLLEKSEKDLASSSELLNICAEIAKLIRTPDDDVSFLLRIVLSDHFNRNVLTEDEIQSALQSFPDDPVLLLIAAKFYLNRYPDRTMNYITKFKDLKDVPEESKSSADVLHMVTLDRLGRQNEAEKEFRVLVEKGGDENLLYLYYEFCIENSFIDSLKSLAAWLGALPADSEKRAVLPFVQAEILLSEGETEQALGLFEKSSSNDPRFVFHAASRLAEAGRNDAAFKRYLSVKDTYPDKALININLSELYFGQGDMKNALACAEAAWAMDRSSLLGRYIYGKRLYEAGQYAEAVAVLKFPQHLAFFPKEMLDVWSRAIREQIKADFKAERYTPAMENVNFLLIYFPDDKFGLDYLDRIERIRRHETVGGSGAK